MFAQTLTRSVDPLIGTDGGGNTFPGAVRPFGMAQFSPDTRSPSIGYGYGDRQIEGFSLTHMSGVGCDDFGDVFLTATTGPVRTKSRTTRRRSATDARRPRRATIRCAWTAGTSTPN